MFDAVFHRIVNRSLYFASFSLASMNPDISRVDKPTAALGGCSGKSRRLDGSLFA